MVLMVLMVLVLVLVLDDSGVHTRLVLTVRLSHWLWQRLSWRVARGGVVRRRWLGRHRMAVGQYVGSRRIGTPRQPAASTQWVTCRSPIVAPVVAPIPSTVTTPVAPPFATHVVAPIAARTVVAITAAPVAAPVGAGIAAAHVVPFSAPVALANTEAIAPPIPAPAPPRRLERTLAVGRTCRRRIPRLAVPPTVCPRGR